MNQVLSWIAATCLLLPTVATAVQPAGQRAFQAHQCGLCHSVPAAGVRSRTQSAKMKGPDLGGRIEAEFAQIAAFLRKQGPIDGTMHKKSFKGTDEELQTILDWLASQR